MALFLKTGAAQHMKIDVTNHINGLKIRNHMVISIGREIPLTKSEILS